MTASLSLTVTRCLLILVAVGVVVLPPGAVGLARAGSTANAAFSSGSIAVPDPTVHGGLTLELWHKTFATLPEKLISFGVSTEPNNLILRCSAGKVLEVRVVGETFASSVGCGDGTWHHTAVVLRASGEVVLIDSLARTSAVLGTAAAMPVLSSGCLGLLMGYSSGCSTRHEAALYGYTADVRVWEVERSLADVVGAHSACLSPLSPGLVYNWLFLSPVDFSSSVNLVDAVAGKVVAVGSGASVSAEAPPRLACLPNSGWFSGAGSAVTHSLPVLTDSAGFSLEFAFFRTSGSVGAQLELGFPSGQALTVTCSASTLQVIWGGTSLDATAVCGTSAQLALAHVFVTYETASDTLSLIVDGVARATQSGGGLGAAATAGPWCLRLGKPSSSGIACGAPSGGTGYIGVYDNVRLWQRVVGPTEASLASQAARGCARAGSRSSLAAEWLFDSFVGSIVPDTTGNGHALALEGPVVGVYNARVASAGCPVPTVRDALDLTMSSVTDGGVTEAAFVLPPSSSGWAVVATLSAPAPGTPQFHAAVGVPGVALVGCDATGRLFVELGGGASALVLDPPALCDGAWHTVTLSVNASAATVTLIQDTAPVSVLVSEASSSVLRGEAGSGLWLTLGQDATPVGTPGRDWEGYVAGLSFYETPLQAANAPSGVGAGACVAVDASAQPTGLEPKATWLFGSLTSDFVARVAPVKPGPPGMLVSGAGLIDSLAATNSRLGGINATGVLEPCPVVPSPPSRPQGGDGGEDDAENVLGDSVATSPLILASVWLVLLSIAGALWVVYARLKNRKRQRAQQRQRHAEDGSDSLAADVGGEGLVALSFKDQLQEEHPVLGIFSHLQHPMDPFTDKVRALALVLELELLVVSALVVGLLNARRVQVAGVGDRGSLFLLSVVVGTTLSAILGSTGLKAVARARCSRCGTRGDPGTSQVPTRVALGIGLAQAVALVALVALLLALPSSLPRSQITVLIVVSLSNASASIMVSWLVVAPALVLFRRHLLGARFAWAPPPRLLLAFTGDGGSGSGSGGGGGGSGGKGTELLNSQSMSGSDEDWGLEPDEDDESSGAKDALAGARLRARAKARTTTGRGTPSRRSFRARSSRRVGAS